MYETFVSIIVAIAGIIAIIFSCLRNRVFVRTGNTNDNIGNTTSRISDGVGDVNSAVKRVEDTTADITSTSKELEVGIGNAQSSIDDAKATVTNIRKLVQARRETIEENDL